MSFPFEVYQNVKYVVFSILNIFKHNLEIFLNINSSQSWIFNRNFALLIPSLSYTYSPDFVLYFLLKSILWKGLNCKVTENERAQKPRL